MNPSPSYLPAQPTQSPIPAHGPQAAGWQKRHRTNWEEEIAYSPPPQQSALAIHPPLLRRSRARAAAAPPRSRWPCAPRSCGGWARSPGPAASPRARSRRSPPRAAAAARRPRPPRPRPPTPPPRPPPPYPRVSLPAAVCGRWPSGDGEVLWLLTPRVCSAYRVAPGHSVQAGLARRASRGRSGRRSAPSGSASRSP